MEQVQTLITPAQDLTADMLRALLEAGYQPNPPGLLLWARMAPPEVHTTQEEALGHDIGGDHHRQRPGDSDHHAVPEAVD